MKNEPSPSLVDCQGEGLLECRVQQEVNYEPLLVLLAFLGFTILLPFCCKMVNFLLFDRKIKANKDRTYEEDIIYPTKDDSTICGCFCSKKRKLSSTKKEFSESDSRLPRTAKSSPRNQTFQEVEIKKNAHLGEELMTESGQSLWNRREGKGSHFENPDFLAQDRSMRNISSSHHKRLG